MNPHNIILDVSFEKMKSAVISRLHGREVNADALFVLDDLDSMNDGTPTDASIGSGAVAASVSAATAQDVEETIAFVKQSASHLSATEAFLLGGMSKFIATLLTYPFQVAQTRLRAKQQQSPRAAAAAANKTQSFSDDAGGEDASHSPFTRTLRALQRSSIMQTFTFLLEMLRTEGIASWFKGFTAKLTQTVLNTAVMFVIYEKLSAWVFYFLLRRKLQKGT
jgi:hypothetical protein